MTNELIILQPQSPSTGMNKWLLVAVNATMHEDVHAALCSIQAVPFTS